jgi:hypothetical protein
LTPVASGDDPAANVNRLLEGVSPADRQRLLDALLPGQGFAFLAYPAAPRLRRRPRRVRGFRVRLDLRHVRPPIWRRLVLPGDLLWYEYDFGDSWEHVLKVEAVLPDPPAQVELLTGRRACPPEDIGGVGGDSAVADWVSSGHDHRRHRRAR